MKKEKKIPTILGLIFLLISIVAGVYLSSTTINTRSKASGDCNPINIQTTNITHTSFAISFSTSTDCPSLISLDSRIINNFVQTSKIHYFSVDNLKESTEYSYSIVSGGATYEEPSFTVKTAKKPSGTAPSADIAWGKVYNPDKSPGAYSLVYLIIPDGSPLSALVTSNGNWNITFANSYNTEKEDWFTPQPNIDEEIYIVSEDGHITQIIGNTSRNNPVPDIIIGQDVFTSEQIVPESIGNVGLGSDYPSSSAVTILNPKNGETLSTLRPDFFGTASPNYTLTVSISGPTNASGSPVSDSTGTWHWSPVSNLIPGNYVIKAETAEHNFSVSGESDSLAYTASGSGSLTTPTQIPIPSPTETPVSISQTPTPVSTLFPTPSSTIEPTSRTYKPSTDSGVPKTGTSFPTILLGVLSVSLLVFGFLLI
ncbi:MAG: hypothetical protein WC841_00380 [Candidatus Shapirobacteria bacterium]|jgi:hypothetical protein